MDGTHCGSSREFFERVPLAADRYLLVRVLLTGRRTACATAQLPAQPWAPTPCYDRRGDT